MSYDVSLTIYTGNEDHSVYEANYMYNCGPMFSLAITEGINNGTTYRLRDLDGYSAKDVCTILDSAVFHMEHNKEQYLPLNPKNGWGDYDSAKGWLKEIAENCHLHSKCVFKVT